MADERRVTRRDPADRRVVHIGNDPNGAGGIASVIRVHLARSEDAVGFREEAWASYRDGDSFRANLSRFLSTFSRLVRSKVRGDVVHVHISNRGSLLREGSLIWLSRAKGASRLVVTVHGSSAATASRGWRMIYRSAVRPAHRVHLLSDAHRSLMPPHDSRVVVLPNDVRLPSRVSPVGTRENLVVFLGQVSRRKGVDVLLRAWSTVDLPAWRLELHGEMVTESAALLERLPVSARYEGFLASAEIPALLQRATMLVLPSRAEAFPMALCEAMAAGCTVVATDVGGIPEILRDDLTVQMVSVEDAGALATTIEKVLGDPGLTAELAASNRARAADFSSEALTPRWKDIYEGGRGG